MKSNQDLDRVLFAVAGAGPLLFFVVATVEGFLRADYDPMVQAISALALGPRGWIQEANFALLAVSLLSFAVVLRMQFPRGVGSVAGPAGFVLMAVGISMAGLFTMDPEGASPTLSGQLHGVGGFLFFPWIPPVLLLVARRFGRDERWRPHLANTLATGLFCLATFVFFMIFVGLPDWSPRPFSELRGLLQRVLLLPFLVWMALVARHAYREPMAAATAEPSRSCRSAGS